MDTLAARMQYTSIEQPACPGELYGMQAANEQADIDLATWVCPICTSS